ESRITYARFEFNANSTTTPCIEVNVGSAFLDHLTFANPASPYIHVDGASFTISDCYFPAPTTGFELCHGTGGVRSDGHGIFARNFFGKANNYNDVVDFTGSQRGTPIVQFINNVVMGGDDDGFDLDGTDAWVEGNIFMHMHRNAGTPDSSSGVSGGFFKFATTGEPAGTNNETSQVTIIRNIFFDVDSACDAKETNFFAMYNNTIVHQTHVGGVDPIGSVFVVADPNTAEGHGFYFEGNIVSDIEQWTRGVTNAIITLSNNIIPIAWTGLGGGNSITNPVFKHVPAVSETFFTNWAQAQIMWDWLSLQMNSPGIGTGPNGTDKGAVNPRGASISGEPSGTTTQTNVTLHVGINRTGNGISPIDWPLGSGYIAYKWRLDGGAWSAETPINTPITLNGLADGPHYVEASGKNDAGFYQDDPIYGPDAVVTRTPTWNVQASLRFSSTMLSGQTLNLTFTAVAGNTYTVQYKLNLSDPTWTKLSDVPAQPSTGPFVITEHVAGLSKFYRIVNPMQP
ncbi:MAG TPA: hypothetical protein VGE41_04290, partial [Verrucomicrobiae bacterium]